MVEPLGIDESLFPRFEADGYSKVSEDVAHKRYYEKGLTSAKVWLLMQKRLWELAEEKRKEDLYLAEIDIARSAKNATWVSAAVSALALAISIIALWVSLTHTGGTP